jgi:hypothetical protein
VRRKNMKTYNAYSKLMSKKGTPSGTQYLSGTYTARNKEEAERKARRDNQNWARRTGQYAPKIMSVKPASSPQTKTGRTKKRRRTNDRYTLFGF